MTKFSSLKAAFFLGVCLLITVLGLIGCQMVREDANQRSPEGSGSQILTTPGFTPTGSEEIEAASMEAGPESVKTQQGRITETEPADSETMTKSIISGRVINRSFVPILPESPYASGFVLAISPDRLASFLDEATVVYLGDTLQRATFLIDEETFNSHLEASSALRPGGVYSLDVFIGTYIICVANLGRVDSGDFPMEVQGCVDNIQIKESMELALDLFFSDSGLTLTRKQ